jgi:hypothetical protein
VCAESSINSNRRWKKKQQKREKKKRRSFSRATLLSGALPLTFSPSSFLLAQTNPNSNTVIPFAQAQFGGGGGRGGGGGGGG